MLVFVVSGFQDGFDQNAPPMSKPDDLRDKRVLKFDREAVRGLTLTQGTTQSPGTTNITLQAPAAVTSYVRTLEGSVGNTGVYVGTVTGVGEGKWGIEIEGETGGSRVFTSQNSVFLR